MLRMKPLSIARRLAGAMAGLVLVAGTGAHAQTATPAIAGTAIAAPPPSTPTHYDLQPPVFGAGANSVYDLNVAGTQNGPAGTIAITSAIPQPSYSFEDYARSVHGTLSTGVSSNGGHEFSGMVNLPLVPGRADLDLGLSTGQLGGFRSLYTNKNKTAGYDAYYAGLHIHPADDWDAYISVSGLRVKAPPPGSIYLPP